MASYFACMPLLWLCYGCWMLGVVCELNDFDRECANIHFEEWILRVWFFCDFCLIFLWMFQKKFTAYKEFTKIYANSQSIVLFGTFVWICMDLYGFHTKLICYSREFCEILSKMSVFFQLEHFSIENVINSIPRIDENP